MQKNVKGFISLGAALAAIILTFVGFSPLGKVLKYPMWSSVNQTLGCIALILCVAAIVFAILSFKDKDKKGPRKTGMILGILCILIAWIPVVLGWFGGAIIGYANGESNFISEEMDKYAKGDKDSYLYKAMESGESEGSATDLKNLLDDLVKEHDKNAK